MPKAKKSKPVKIGLKPKTQRTALIKNIARLSPYETLELSRQKLPPRLVWRLRRRINALFVAQGAKAINLDRATVSELKNADSRLKRRLDTRYK